MKLLLLADSVSCSVVFSVQWFCALNCKSGRADGLLLGVGGNFIGQFLSSRKGGGDFIDQLLLVFP